jgi:hypothetical protein
MGKSIILFGLAGLTHAAYSATQHRTFLRLTERDFSQLPIDIIAQTLLSLLLCCFGIIGISGKFKPIQITSEWENKRWDNIANRTSFYSFTHRGKYLFSADEQPEEDLDEEKEYLEVKAKLEKIRLAKQQELYRKQGLQQNNQEEESSEEGEDEIENLRGDLGDSEATSSSEDLDQKN